MAEKMYCIDERHDTPCPAPCLACDADCGPPVGIDQARAEFPEWDPE